ncbi:MAG: GNAT family N-acetyltransferase, partial [Clostridia bacterium]|nr:GNAT family N-acetyltransferase [Clostridia bacterium]
RPKYQGVGLGTRLNAAAVRCLLENGLETAYLTTDDFRIPAIRSYLRAGFYPDVKDDSHRERWDKIYEIIGR